MFDHNTTVVEEKCGSKTRAAETGFTSALPRHPDLRPSGYQTGFSKVFRWPVEFGQKQQPKAVEVVGSFSEWRKVPLNYDPPSRTWFLIVNIQGNRTHRYVMLVDGKPCYDKACDGLAAPQNSEEMKWQFTTPKGPRVMLLFGQTK